MTHQSITHKVALSEFVKRKKNEIVIKRKWKLSLKKLMTEMMNLEKKGSPKVRDPWTTRSEYDYQWKCPTSDF